MRESEYIALSDLRAVLTCKQIIRDANFFDEPHKSLIKAVMRDLTIIEKDLFKKIKVKSDK